MKLKKLFIYAAIFLTLTFSGCILDSWNEIPLDIPITFAFNAAGDANSLMDDGSFCLTDNELYQDYQEKIKDIKLLEITFRPTEVTPATMKGTVRIIIKKSNAQGALLLDQSFPNLTPASYVAPNLPYVLQLTQQQLTAIDNYLKENGTCFYVAVSVENVTPSGTKTIKGQVDFVFRANTELN